MAQQNLSRAMSVGKNPCFRTLYGATVQFREGGHVCYVKLPSDALLVCLSNLPADINYADLSDVLQSFGFQYSGTNISIYDRKESGSSAEVQLDDCYMAEVISQSLDQTLLGNHEISVRLLRSGSLYETSLNRLQITSVACSWHKPSRLAWANYVEKSEAEKAAHSGDGSRLDGHFLQCRMRPPRNCRGGAPLYPVQIRNLAPETTKDTMVRFCPSAVKVVLGRLSYDLSKDDVRDRIQGVLARAGELMEFGIQESTNPRYARATARYASPQHVRNAVRDLHGSIIPGLGFARLYLN